MTNNEESKYSTQLFDKQFDKIRTELENYCNSKSIRFKGLWAFAYLEGANSLKSIYFNHVDIDRLEKDYEGILSKIKQTRLDCDYGSLGFAFQTLNGNNNSSVEFLRDTYNDAKGTVCYFDLIISQEHACFVIIKKGNEALGVLDFFFDGNLTEECENNIVSFFQERFNSHKNQQYLTDFINAFKIKEYGYFLEIQNEEKGDVINTGGNEKELSNAAEYIERILATSSKTPLMVIKHQQGEYFPELVVLNFDFIHSLIKHEHRFCPLTTEKDCFYFKGYNSFIDHALRCDNTFLKLFYYDILKELNAIVITNKINVFNVEYNIEIVCSDENISIEKSNFLELSNEVKKINFSSRIAKNKYRDERVYLVLDTILKKDDRVYAFSLSRKTKPYLKFSAQCANDDESDCCQRNDCVSSANHKIPIKQFISPSTILPVQYAQITNSLLIKIKSQCNNNIFHFKITNEKVFKQAQKRLIAISPDSYLAALKPYLNITTNGEPSPSYHHNLFISLIGEDPLQDNKFAEIIKGKFNLIEALLQEEEIKLQASKAAIIQYMARNLSHNTGSHLIPEAIDYFKQYLIHSTGTQETVNLKDKFIHYQKYTQERMELLAQLSSMRDNHNWNNYSFNEIVYEFSKPTKSIIPKGLCDDLNKNQKAISITVKGQTDVALPDGAVGKQAFYVILENFIRNAYKHSIPKIVNNQKTYLFELKVSEPEISGREDYWCIDIYDKLGNSNKVMRTPEMLSIINNLISESVLTKGQLRENGWGLLEMKSASAFLQGYKLELLDKFKLCFFQANYYDDYGNIETTATVRNFGHRFYLAKPKLLIIDKKIATKYHTDNETELKKKGIIISEIDDKVKKMPHLFIVTAKELEFSNQKILKEIIETNNDLVTIENTLWEKFLSCNNLNNTIIVADNNVVDPVHNNTAFFDSHGMTLTLDNGHNLNKIDKNTIDGLGLHYYHPFKSRSKIQELLSDISQPRFKGLLLEGINNKVLIIDERIQNAANAKDNDQPNLFIKEILSLIGVDIPIQNLSNYIENPDEQTGKQLINLIKNEQYKYVILHLTILEKLSGKSKKTELKNFIDNTDNGIGEKANFDDKNRAFVLVSGRGQPPNLPDGTFYINYTTLYDCLVYRMSKPHLMQILITLRKQK